MTQLLTTGVLGHDRSSLAVFGVWQDDLQSRGGAEDSVADKLLVFEEGAFGPGDL